jgi:hypothetical protein
MYSFAVKSDFIRTENPACQMEREVVQQESISLGHGPRALINSLHD